MAARKIPSGEAAGALASFAFTCLAAVRDVYFGGLFQSTSPLGVALVAFTLCSVIFLPIALIQDRGSVRRLLSHRRELFWVNVTTGLAWISFFYALRAIEPLLVQILFAGVGPLSVLGLDRFLGLTPPATLGQAERPIYVGLAVSLLAAAAVAVAGLSGAGPQPLGTAASGIILAVFAGTSISASTVLSRRLNDRGVAPAALISLRFVGAIVLAAALSLISGADVLTSVSKTDVPIALGAAVLLIVLPNYVNQVGVSLASPLTVRAVMAIGPVLIFALQLVEGRLSPSPCSLGAALLYGVFALAAAIARGRRSAIRVGASPIVP